MGKKMTREEALKRRDANVKKLEDRHSRVLKVAEYLSELNEDPSVTRDALHMTLIQNYILSGLSPIDVEEILMNLGENFEFEWHSDRKAQLEERKRLKSKE